MNPELQDELSTNEFKLQMEIKSHQIPCSEKMAEEVMLKLYFYVMQWYDRKQRKENYAQLSTR